MKYKHDCFSLRCPFCPLLDRAGKISIGDLQLHYQTKAKLNHNKKKYRKFKMYNRLAASARYARSAASQGTSPPGPLHSLRE